MNPYSLFRCNHGLGRAVRKTDIVNETGAPVTEKEENSHRSVTFVCYADAR